ncbi:Uma2 family endonuclease [Spirosoma areae]
MTDDLVAELLDAPDAKLIIERVQAVLNNEATKRQAFYEWLQDDVKAEFINGEVIMHSPVKRRHLRANGNLTTLLRVYVQMHDLGEVDTEKALITLTRNDYEPDICFWRKDIADEFTDDTMKHPAPDLVVEILSKGTAKRDRGIKFEDYAAHGVREYWLVDPIRQVVEQFRLDEEFMAFDAVGNFHLNDTLTALTVRGFAIPIRAIFESEANALTLRALLQ